MLLDENTALNYAASEFQAPPEPGTSVPPDLASWTGYLLGRAADMCRSHFDALIEPYGIRWRHFRILAVLSGSVGLAQIEMSDQLGIDRNTVVLLLDDLQALGLIVRNRDPRDRRAHVVTLTDAGRDVLVRATQLAQQTNDEVFSPLTPTERGQLRRLLLRLF